MKKFLILLLCFIVFGVTAAEACYSPREFEAEQGMRIHSELMVIGLTCIKMQDGEDLYRKYQSFTVKNSRWIAGYEEDLLRYYSRQGISNPDKKLHTLRTNLANEISRRAITMSTLNFCQKFASHIDQALMMDQDKLRRWARQTWRNQPTTERMCSKVARQG